MFDGVNRISAIGGDAYAYDGHGRRVATWTAEGRTKVEVYTQSGVHETVRRVASLSLGSPCCSFGCRDDPCLPY